MAWVAYNVPLIPQCGDQTCWYASARMIVRWHRQSRRQSTVAGWDVDTAPTSSAVCSANPLLNPSSVAIFARAAHLQTVYASFTAEGLGQLLNAHGPLWYGGRVRGYRGVNTGSHVVVIRGISGNDLLINDPWAPGVGLKHSVDHNTFFGQLQAVGNVPFLYV